MLRIRTKKSKNRIELNYTRYMLHGNFRNIPHSLDPIRSQVVHMYNAKFHNIEKRIGESLWKREKM